MLQTVMDSIVAPSGGAFLSGSVGAIPLRTEAVLDAIKHAILAGELQPGQSLVETELAQLLGVSKTPVREALKTLAGAGLVTMSPYRGATVREIDPETAHAIYDLRLLLEPEAVRRRCRRTRRRPPAPPGRPLDRADASSDEAERSLANREFHRALYLGCGNSLLVKALDDLRDQTALVSAPSWQQAARRGSRRRPSTGPILAAAAAARTPTGRPSCSPRTSRFRGTSSYQEHRGDPPEWSTDDHDPRRRRAQRASLATVVAIPVTPFDEVGDARLGRARPGDQAAGRRRGHAWSRRTATPASSTRWPRTRRRDRGRVGDPGGRRPGRGAGRGGPRRRPPRSGAARHAARGRAPGWSWCTSRCSPYLSGRGLGGLSRGHRRGGARTRASCCTSATPRITGAAHPAARRAAART